ncbi:uncharacterized protein LOC119582268 [Penaeus monodon]|uniref:uncharacterized protein LOC119582268 n=1 Tax=Penaeus monodon TaxID=6687 RepID=UPI0018A71B41|nr:uncharacterized protein LOC119582268 [Penaeus monodon]
MAPRGTTSQAPTIPRGANPLPFQPLVLSWESLRSRSRNSKLSSGPFKKFQVFQFPLREVPNSPVSPFKKVRVFHGVPGNVDVQSTIITTALIKESALSNPLTQFCHLSAYLVLACSKRERGLDFRLEIKVLAASVFHTKQPRYHSLVYRQHTKENFGLHIESVFSTLSQGRMCYWALVSFVLVAALQSDIAACQESCQPECTGAKPFVPDPMNCTRYYFCLADGSPTDAPLTCKDGMEFNPETGYCEPGDPANPCTALCPVPQCSFKCTLGGESVGLVRDPYDCGMFHVCTPAGTFGPFQCQANVPYFNGDICVEKEDVCCTQGCRPFCESSAGLAQDPLDCRKYYNCSAGDLGAPLSCLEGSTFDPAIGQCVEGRPCRDCGGGSGVTDTSVIVPADTTITATAHPADTTKAPPTTTTAPPAANTTTPPSCNVPAVCSASGNFPICNFCHERYYFCPRVGAKPSIMNCINDLVFNTELSYPYCILRDICPFTSSG